MATERLAIEFEQKLELQKIEAAAEIATAKAAAAAELATAKAVAAVELATAKAVAAVELAAVKAASAAELAAAQSASAEMLAESRRELAASHKNMFFVMLDGMSAAASERSSADVSRRGAPKPTLAHAKALLAVFPLIPDSVVAAAWEGYRRTHSTLHEAGKKFTEVSHVQPIISRLIRYAGGHEMLLHEFVGKVPDEISVDSIEPDHTLTAARDLLPNLLGAVVQIEDKLPGDLNRAVSQVLKYGRRRIRVVTREADIRGEPLDNISTFLCGTDGHEIVFAMMKSGAPYDNNFAGAVPCPCETTAPLPLLHGWDFADASWKPPIIPPAGFAALVRILRAPLSCFDQNGIALRAISVTITDHGSRTFDLPLGNRLGSGGTSDVYAVSITPELDAAIMRTAARGGASTAPSSIKADPGAESVVVKLARFSSAAVDEQFGRESQVLRLLDAASDRMTGLLFPRLLLCGRRSGVGMCGAVQAGPVEGGAAAAPAADVSSSASQRKGHSAWPFLMISPQGETVESYVNRTLEDSRDASASAASVSSSTPWLLRLELADALTRDLLHVLHVAHTKRLIHCDLRPQNVVVFNGRAVLCDWGLCVDATSDVTGRGVPAYCDSHLFLGSQKTFAARPRVDLVAAAYFWVSVVFGGRRCEAPWVQRGDTTLEILAKRQAWFAAHASDRSETRESLRCCSMFLEASVGADNKKLHPALYSWPYSR